MKFKAANMELESLRSSIVEKLYKDVNASISNVVETANVQTIIQHEDGTISGKVVVVDEIYWNDGATERKSVITIPHDITFAKKNNKYVILKDTYQELPVGVDSEDIDGAKYRANAPKDHKMKEAKIEDDPNYKANKANLTVDTFNSVARIDVYNRSGAVSYAHSYTNSSATGQNGNFEASYNSAYKNFNPLGGDCTNFASQAMYIGGGAPLYGSSSSPGGTTSTQYWYYNNQGTSSLSDDSWTSSWTLAAESYTHQISSYGYGFAGTKSSMALGDLIYVKWHTNLDIHHVFVVTGFTATGEPIITCHNIDAYDVPLANDIYSDTVAYYVNIHVWNQF